MTKCTTQWGGSTVSVSADFAQATQTLRVEVDGEPVRCAYRVADAGHRPAQAMRLILVDFGQEDGSARRGDFAALVETAIGRMTMEGT